MDRVNHQFNSGPQNPILKTKDVMKAISFVNFEK